MKRNILLFHGILFFLYIFTLFSQTLPEERVWHQTTILHDISRLELYPWVFLCFILGYHVIKLTALLTNQSVPVSSFIFLFFSACNIYTNFFLVLLALIDFVFHVVFSIWKNKSITSSVYTVFIFILLCILLYVAALIR